MRSFASCKNVILMLLILTFSSITLSAQTKTLLVINNLGETLTTVDLSSSIVTNNVAVLGNAPNHVLLSDDYAYVTNSTSADIYKINLRNLAEVTVFPLPSGSNPWEIFKSPADNKSYVSNSGLNSFSQIDLSDGSILNTTETGIWPQDIVEYYGMLYVVNTGFDINTYAYNPGKISIVNPSTLAIEDSIIVPKNPQDLILGSDDMLYALCTGDYFTEFGSLIKIDPSTNSVVDTISTGGSPNNMVLTNSGKIFIAAGGAGWSPGDDGHVFIYDTVNDTLLNDSENPIVTAASTSRIVADGDEAVYVTCFADDQVQKLNAETGEILATYDVGDGPQGLALYSGNIVSSVDDEPDLIVHDFQLDQNYPNPFNPETTIRYNIPKAGMVRIAVYSVTGQEVAVLKSGIQAAGYHSVSFNGTGLASGIYFYSMTANGTTITKKMMLVK